MRFDLRIKISVKELDARIRAAAQAARRGRSGSSRRGALPSSSNIRDPDLVAGLTRFDEEPGRNG